MLPSLVRPEDRRRIDAFVEDYRKSPYARDERAEPLTISPSPIDEEMVRDHENLLGIALPPLFRAYLVSWSLADTDLYVGQLPPILPGHPFEYVERWSIELLRLPFYRRNQRLMPFVLGPADCSEYCFDIYRQDSQGDYPIVDVWHSPPQSEDREWSDLDCERFQRFDDFSTYFDFLHEWVIYKTIAPKYNFNEWLRSSTINPKLAHMAREAVWAPNPSG